MRYPALVERSSVADRASLETAFGRRATADTSSDWIRIAALAGLCLDGLTTWIVLGAASYRELNPIIDGLWDGHPLLVMGYFGGFVLVVSAMTRRRGWVSTAVSAYVVVVMGVFGGLNNLALFIVGPPGLLDLLAATVGISGVTAIQSLVPACGLSAALGAAHVRHNSFRWHEVAAVTSAVVVSAVILRWVPHLLEISSL